MRDEDYRLLNSFVSLHGHQAHPTEEPVAYLQFAESYRGGDSGLIIFQKEDIPHELNVESELVRWLLKQLNTYDCRSQRIIGLIFDRDTVLSEVLRVADGS